jgi:hypothetical protein
MPEVTANLFDNENDALSHAASVVSNLDLNDILNPKRLVQVDTEMLFSKRASVRGEALQKVAKLEAQLNALRSSHGFLSEGEE